MDITNSNKTSCNWTLLAVWFFAFIFSGSVSIVAITGLLYLVGRLCRSLDWVVSYNSGILVTIGNGFAAVFIAVMVPMLVYSILSVAVEIIGLMMSPKDLRSQKRPFLPSK